MLQYDIIVNILDSMYNDGVRAAELAETDSSDLDPVKDLLDAIKEFRDEDIAEYNEQAGGYFKLVQTIAMLTGVGLIATGVLGIVAPASLVRTQDLYSVVAAARLSMHHLGRRAA